MNAPFQGFPPELLAKMAQGAFRPPAGMPAPIGMQVPGMQAPQQQAPGFNVGEGMAGLGFGLGMLGRMGGDVFDAKGRTAGDADLGGYGSSPVDPMGGNPNAQPVEVFNPTGAASGGGLGGLFGKLGLKWPPGGLF